MSKNQKFLKNEKNEKMKNRKWKKPRKSEGPIRNCGGRLLCHFVVLEHDVSIDKVSRNIFRFHRIVVLQDQIRRPLLWDDHYCFLQRFKVLAEFDWMWEPLNLFLPNFSFHLCMGR